MISVSILFTSLIVLTFTALSKQLPASTISLPRSSLPAPPSDLSLKYIALGLGTQNYTCASSTSKPILEGALANLYDFTSVVSALTPAQQSNITCWADHADSSQLEALLSNKAIKKSQLGVHFFNAAGVPNFNLYGASPRAYLQATKVAASPAPSPTCAGRNGAGPVAWLELVADGSGESLRLGAVYRVQTAGGMAPASGCAGEVRGVVTSDYAAQYWFYG